MGITCYRVLTLIQMTENNEVLIFISKGSSVFIKCRTGPNRDFDF